MSDTSLQHVEGVLLVALVVAGIITFFVRRFRRTRPDLRIAWPIGVGLALRLLAIAGISSTGLESVLRGGDEITFLDLAHLLAQQPLGHGDLPHGPYQLQTVLFALQLKLGFLSVGALRITQVGLAWFGILLIVIVVHDLADARAARWAAWIFAFEPTSIFFNSELHKEPLMELAAGLVVFGGSWIWRRLDLRGLLVCALGGAIAVETRSYAGWFLVAAAVFVLFHAAIRGMNRPLRAMPVIYGILIAAFLVTPTLLAASSHKSLQVLQESQNANASGAGEGTGTSNSSNLALEQVNFSSRGAVLANLPKRMSDLVLQPYPWRLQDSSQRFGAIGTLVAYALLFLLIRYAWLSRRHVLPRAGPVLYPMLFLLVAYSLAVGNAGTGFRYRSHLVTLAIAAVVILRAHLYPAAANEPAATAKRARRRRGGVRPAVAPQFTIPRGQPMIKQMPFQTGDN